LLTILFYRLTEVPHNINRQQLLIIFVVDAKGAEDRAELLVALIGADREYSVRIETVHDVCCDPGTEGTEHPFEQVVMVHRW